MTKVFTLISSSKADGVIDIHEASAQMMSSRVLRRTSLSPGLMRVPT